MVGSGFGQIERSGVMYPSFPDLRLVFSEKDRIRAWVLLDEQIDVNLFATILPVLDFPPIYTTRSIIAKFRKMNVLEVYREKFRFFEIFSEEISVRRVAGMELGVVALPGRNIFAVKSGKQLFAYEHLPVESEASFIGECRNIRSTSDGYFFGDQPFEVGEIIALSLQGEILKQSMRFSFDTFYQDGESVGVVAGYVLTDRDTLARGGVLVFTLTEDPRARTIAGHIFIDSRGFVHSYEMMRVHKEILKAIRMNYEALVAEKPSIERGELAGMLRKEIAKYCLVLTGRTPVVMPIIQ